MSDIPITNNIRKVIFEILKKNDMIDQSLTIDDMEAHFKELCDSELLRNIAQNFTTQWFKLFEPLEKIQCGSCEKENYITQSESRKCQNSSCGSTI